MKLATLQTDRGIEVAAVIETAGGTSFVSLSRLDPTLPGSLKAILAADSGLARCRAALDARRANAPAVSGTLLAPIPDPGKVICIGLNYRDHAIEAGMKIPEEPVCFGKFGNAIIGPDAPVRIPRVAHQVDYEAELVIVIGRRAYDVSAQDAFQYVAGYCNGNDVSARDWQINKPGKQWMLGKTPDTFAPIGPWLVTAEEVNPHALPIALRLNGQTMQSGNTREFIFGVDHIVSYLSQLMTLEPGDVIFTGTPPGVGMGRTPPLWLKPGDVMEVEIAGLGVLRNPVVGP